MNKKDLFSIPNVLSLVRLLLIPIFAWTYLTASGKDDFYLAAIIVVISGVTDFLDGFIARQFNMITELGKFLDPLADKLTQGTLFLCLAIRHPLMWLLLAIWALKDGFMGIMGFILLKKKHAKLDGAKWYGKVCTAIIYVAVLLLLFFPSVFSPDSPQSVVMILICAGALLLSGILYAMVLIGMWLHNETVISDEKASSVLLNGVSHPVEKSAGGNETDNAVAQQNTAVEAAATDTEQNPDNK